MYAGGENFEFSLVLRGAVVSKPRGVIAERVQTRVISCVNPGRIAARVTIASETSDSIP